MGLTNAVPTFQRLMIKVFRSYYGVFVLVYVDDVIVYSFTFEEHLTHLKTVVDCLREANLTLNRKKCIFAQRRVQYLGHVIDENGIHTDPAKTQKVSRFPTPRSVGDIRCFLDSPAVTEGSCRDLRRLLDRSRPC